MTRLRVVVLVSGRGSNLEALIDARDRGLLAVDLVLVASDRADARALTIARRAKIPTVALDPKTFPDRLSFDQALFRRIEAVQPDLIVCAGYMRVISAEIVGVWSSRMINIHPSLLPAYPGLHTHARALADRATVHGASVHFVTADLDAGPVIAQTRIAIEPGDTPESLAARLLPLEHRLLVAVVGLFAARRVVLDGRQVQVDGAPIAHPLVLSADGALA